MMRAKDTFAQVYAIGSPFFDENQYQFMTLKNKQTFMGEGDLGRAWLLQSGYSKTPNTSTDTEGAVESRCPF